MKKKIIGIIYLFFVFQGILMAQQKKQLKIALSFTPRFEKDVSIKALAENKYLFIDPFVDLREGNQSTVGENMEHEYPILIRSTVPVSEYARDVFKKFYFKWGGSTSPDSKLHLKCEIKTFNLVETNLYRSNVLLHMFLVDEMGAKRWESNISGNAKVFGRSLKEENYNEAFTDALQDIYEIALTDIGFWSSWDKKTDSSQVATSMGNILVKENQMFFDANEIKNDLLKLKKEGISTQVLVDYTYKKTLKCHCHQIKS